MSTDDQKLAGCYKIEAGHLVTSPMELTEESPKSKIATRQKIAVMVPYRALACFYARTSLI